MGEPIPCRTIDIRPHRGWTGLDPRELWGARDLLWFLILRDFKVRYRQTAIGLAWAAAQPIALMVVFGVFVGRWSRPMDSVPFPLFVLTALVPWQLFAHALASAGTSVVQNEALVSKVYFPRIILPLAATTVGLVDLAVAGALLGLLSWHYRHAPGIAALALPLLIVQTSVAAFAVGTWFSALSVRYRDFRHAMPFIAQIWLLGTPIAYDDGNIRGPWSVLYRLNPMVGIVDGFRAGWLGRPLDACSLGISAAVTVVLLASGMLVFRRMERHFSDLL